MVLVRAGGGGAWEQTARLRGALGEAELQGHTGGKWQWGV